MSVLRENWLWLIVLFVTIIITVPFIVIYLVLLLPPIWGPALFMVALMILWAFVSGYKDWVTARRKEEEEKRRVAPA
jgi:Kef-type K+ transport system membrane component KefB